MAKTLGLDLGTNSIGWAVVDTEKENNLIEDKGVVIFSEGVKNEKGTEKSRAAERTSYRSARRLKFRRKIRKYQTLLVLARNGMCPLMIEEVKVWRKSGFKKYPDNEDFLKWLRTDEEKQINPYYFRDKASREKISKFELGRAFYHMAQRRGFLSNRLDQSDKGAIEKHQPELELIINNASSIPEIEQEIKEHFIPLDIIKKNSKDLNAGEKDLKKLYNKFGQIIKGKSDIKAVKEELLERLYKKENLGAVKQGISDLDEKIKNAKCKTLGQYFWKIYQQNRGLKENKIRTKYTAREEHYLAEFEIICQTQGLESIDTTKKDPSLRYSGFTKDLYRAIFYQHPLRSQKGLVGKCTLEPTKARCPASRPEYEEYRMYQFISNIKIKTADDENMRFLTKEERNKIIPKFQRKSKSTFEFIDLKKVLGEQHQYNYKNNATVSGCPTIASLISVFGDDWKEKTYTYETINKKGEVVQRTADYTDIWHVLQTFTSNDKLEEYAIQKLNLDKATAEKFSKINLKQDYASLSLNAINKISPFLKEGLIYSHAVFMANMKNVVDTERWKNKDDRELIENEIKNIIDNHREENKIQFVINSLLKNCIDEGFHYSKEAENGFRDDLHKQFESEFGKKTWNEKEDKEQILSQAFDEFLKHLKSGEFVTIKRIDEKVIDFLADNDLLKDANKLYHPSDIEKFVTETIKDKEGNEFIGLGSPITGSIKNPMAMRALHQLRKLVNTLIKDGVIDERTKINIELARELNDANKRKAILKWQKDREELHQIYADKIKELYKKDFAPTENDIEKFQMALEQREDGVIVGKDEILKYTLWEEQKHICLYTGKTIGLADFLGSNPKYDIEHTIPRSTSLDNSQMNKTLCDNKFNREVKKDRTPFELDNHKAIIERIEHWKKRYEELDKEIERLVRATRGGYMEKEQKDRIIQKRHYLQMEYNYWKGKYDRFVMEEVKQGFKNSQFVDTGIITKYAVAYMKSLFNKVYSVKGEMVDQYRKAWGLHEKLTDNNGKPILDTNGNNVFKKKDRSNHIHHCIDAVTIACMDKVKYDKLAHAWGLEDKGDFKAAREELEQMKPWKIFSEDVKKLQDEVLIVHHTKDVLPKQSKKIERKRGKKQYLLEFETDANRKYKRDENGKKIPKKDAKGKLIYKLDSKGNRIPKIQQGDTVRGSLHQDTFYGTVETKGVQKHVVRKELSKLKESDVKNIVDSNIRAIVEQAKKDGKITFNNMGAKLSYEQIWQNEAKQIPLKKVRVFTPAMKNPLPEFKKHPKPFLSKHAYKQQFNVANDENYCMAIYVGLDKKGNVKRSFKLVNNHDAGKYFKLSNKKERKNSDLVPNPDVKTGYLLKYILKKGMMVLMYDEKPEEIWELNFHSILKRLYKIAKYDTQGRLTFRPHNEAKAASDLCEVYKIDTSKLQEQVRLQVSKLNILVEGYDFKITTTGKIVQIQNRIS
jgi:CRISPR-associated endonuclease Csn1